VRSRCSASPRLVVLVVVLAIAALGLTACFPPPSGTPTSVITVPPLIPDFRADVTNYVVRCDPGTPVEVHVTSPTDTYVSVDDRYPRSGIFGEVVAQTPGQRFTIAITTDPAQNNTKTYNVRCLPTDFPEWTPEPAPYGVTPFFMTAPLAAGVPSYHAIYDRNGVPLWWSDPRGTIFGTLLPDGTYGVMVNGGVEVSELDGTPVRTVKTVGGGADPHDVLLLPNGHYVMVTLQARAGVDLTSLGGPASASICDHVVQEIDPADGSVVWSWDTFDHIPVAEMDPQWESSIIDAGPTIPSCGYDVYHWNAIEPTGTGYLLSYRHLDAVYAIEQATGNVSWKLGGSARAERLTVVGDPVFSGGSHFGGQHDSRLLPDGSVTLYDDGTDLGRGPRAVRYAIDTTAHTATLLESITDPEVPAVFCCGSARSVGPGLWVIGWGGTADVVGRGGEYVGPIRQYALRFPGRLTYRVIPLTSSQVNAQQLIDAMDAKAAGAGASSAPDQTGPTPFPP
jgi:Arylsulfotransferase (ASST)